MSSEEFTIKTMERIRIFVDYCSKLEQANPGFIEWYIKQPEYEEVRYLERKIDEVNSIGEINHLIVSYRSCYIYNLAKFRKLPPIEAGENNG